jgi:hypothetical protein
MKPTILQKVKSAFRTSSRNSLNIEPTPLWYKQDYNREQAEYYLSLKEIGVFVMRKSETIQDCHVLSVKVPKYINSNEISHYLIVKSKSAALQNKKSVYTMRGFTKEFFDLKSLVTHCSFMRDMIPVALNLDFYREENEEILHKRNDFFYYSSSSSSLTSQDSCGDFNSFTSEF